MTPGRQNREIGNAEKLARAISPNEVDDAMTDHPRGAPNMAPIP
jgi:hypothetical protein